MTETLCVSWNLLNAWMPKTAVYQTAAERAPRAAEWIAHRAPDLLCLQEFDYYYRHDTAFLPALGEGYAEASGEGELSGGSWNPILYRSDKWREEAAGRWDFTANGFVPVDTKNDRRETYPAHACNESPRYAYPEEAPEAAKSGSRFRSLSWVLLNGKDREGGRLLVANTHLSLRPWCQTEEADFIHEKLKALSGTYACPVLLCGDFNSGIAVGGAKRLTELGWADTHALAAACDDRASCHPSSGKGEKQERDEMPAPHYPYAIDHVFLWDPTAHVRAEEYRIVAEERLLSVSDHCPTVLRFKINS
ncbi:MAG TPA: hypothetical protein DDW30_02280 [Clostridiales bacterium]|nr:hypothetical protein [Clostridiales bacterium]